MKVVAYSSKDNQDGTITVTESSGQSITTRDMSELFKWLLYEWKPEPDYLCVTWNLGQFTAPILRKLGMPVCRNLANPQYNRSELFRPFIVFFRFKSDTGGLFKIEFGPLHDKHRTHEFSCYSLAQFIDRDAPDPGAELTAVYGQELLRQLQSAGIEITKLTSPIAAYLSAETPPAPRSRDASPEEIYAGEYAEKCSREWRDCFQAGHWGAGESSDHDLTSAYAWCASLLLDNRQAEYVYSKKLLDDAYWGFLKGRVTINADVLVHPIVTEMPNGSFGTPVGTWEGYITLSELRFIERYGIGSFELDDGWFVYPKTSDRPLNKLMTDLYQRRKQAERSGDDILAGFLKGIGNGLVGKFLEKYDRMYKLPDGTETNVGEFYNPIWHATVTSTVRLKVAEYIYQHNAQQNVIGINTDGVLLDTELPTKANPTLGEWRLSGTNPVIVVSPQRVMAGHKHPQGMTYDMLVKLIEDKPDSMEYTETGERYVTLSEAVEAGQLEAVGELATRGRGMILPALWESQTRRFDHFPITGRELLNGRYSSRPIWLK